MIASTFGGLIVAAQVALGMHGHHAVRPGCCETCGRRPAVILAEITRLQTCPNWRKRDDAARVLRHVNPRCHPEVVDALAFALLRDCEEEVREEAAESLTKLATCTPLAHQALTKAAHHDPDHATRKWARRALKAVAGRCVGACQICGPAPAGLVEVPMGIPPTSFPDPVLAPGEILVPSNGPEVVPLPPIDSTVVPPADAPAVSPELAPLPEEAEEVKLLRPAVFLRRGRPNRLPFLLGPPPRTASRR